MAVKMAFLVLLIATVTITLAPLGHGQPDKSPEAVAEWFENLQNARQELTRIHFYIHDVLSGPNQSLVLVAEPDVTFPNNWGQVHVVDERLTAEPEYSSTLVGRSQGLTLSGSKEVPTYVDALSFVFQGGIYNGSTISILGSVVQSDPYLELPIVSGTGAFRLAKGILTSSTTTDPSTGNEIVECDAFILYYVYSGPSPLSNM